MCGGENNVLTDLTNVITGDDDKKAINEANKALTLEKATALLARENAKAQTAAEQLSLSQQASAVRSVGDSSSTTVNRTSSFFEEEERDFLGL